MSAKRALIVDDSRSARAFLTRILERYDLLIDSAASAEEAIEYLNRQRPDVIFMDHLMPGMDGFQALTVIKNDPRTATIPVMMYTSQEGELYLSQARALGAMGVLPKQTRPADVSRALEQLRLLREHRPESEIATVRVSSLGENSAALARDGDSRATEQPIAAPIRPISDTQPIHPAAAVTAEVRAQLDSLLADHGAELRRFVAHSLDQHTGRIVTEVRALMDETISQGEALSRPPARARLVSLVGGRPVLWLSAIAASIAVLAGLLWYRATTGDSPGTARAVRNDSTAAAVPRPRAASILPVAAPAAAGEAGEAVLLIATVPFGEAPLAGARVESVQTVLERLTARGFRGVVEIRSYPGRFCMQGTGDGAVISATETNYAKCELVGNPVDSGGLAGHESVAFANMLSAQRSRSNGAFEIRLGSGDAEEVAASYPAPSESLTAGEWNRAAAANNRIEVSTHSPP